MVLNNYFECLAKPAKLAKLLNTAFFASLADLARTLKKFSYNYIEGEDRVGHSNDLRKSCLHSREQFLALRLKFFFRDEAAGFQLGELLKFGDERFRLI